MLSRLFSNRKAPAAKPHARSVSLEKNKSDANRNQHVMKNSDREVYAFSKPEQEMGMTDLIKDHKSGDRFLYAAVTANQDEEDSSRLRRLIQHQPRLARKPVAIGKLPTLSLYEEVESFNLSSLMPKTNGKGVKTYINISEVLVVYGSLISSDSSFSKVRVCIMDNRLLNNKIAKSYVANTNVISKATMSLSYCFPRDEIDEISLTIAREAAFLEDGRQWGTAQVQIQMQETEFPIQLNNTAVRAINNLPQSVLEDREVDPDFIDISMTENNRQQLRDIYMDGDLADETVPIENRMEAVKYAKSSLQGPRGKKPEHAQPTSDWDFMNTRQKGTVAGDNSVEPSEDGSIKEPQNTVQLRSAMKRKPTPVASPEGSVEEVVRSSPPPEPRSVRIRDPNDIF